MPQSRKTIFFILFFLSGFSGLIYQSIWSHYLKLFLGHAAYAQTLVLVIFMGGMALGSLASGLLLTRWRRLLVGYAIVEGIIGILAIVFHPVFMSVTDYTFTQLLSGMGGSGISANVLKWGVASLLIFPQSVLLGMTFPLMVGGIMRHFPERPGYTLSMLYFTNSLGAVFGILASSFVLISYVGLPGTILSAGLINIALAIVVWGLSKNHVEPLVKNSTQNSSAHSNDDSPLVLPGILLWIALLTGLSSFMYEISWIRMLVLVLGGSTHSFELMVASFILGLALGGLWIRNRIDNIVNPRVFLGYVQLAMALAAILSLWLYNLSFDWMGFVLDSIQRKDSTYGTYLFFSGVISMAIMLPATFCAGMTLPLITNLIIKTNKKENGIGYVYSANTLGAIVGVILSVHFLMPMVGLKNLIGIGATTDLLLGLYLIGAWPGQTRLASKPRFIIATLFVALFSTSFVFSGYDVNRLSSGVYRNGFTTSKGNVVYHGDGKTSTVTVSESLDGKYRIIKNNGKPDASVTMESGYKRREDEDTQILLATYPLALKPQAKAAAIVGMGSGMTTHSLLGSSNLEVVDTIEMESKVLDAAQLFQPVNTRAYTDSRSRLHVEDAKTFFSLHDKQYDIIISEPPNPWVSGVSTLFSQEFYQRIKNHLNPDGVFTQWIQLYEIDINLIATIFNAIDLEFEDYVVYKANRADIVIMASADRKIGEISSTVLDFEDLSPLLDFIGIEEFQDFGAPKARFTKKNTQDLTELIHSSVPVLNFLTEKKYYDLTKKSENSNSEFLSKKQSLIEIRDMLLASESSTNADTSVSNIAVLIEHHLSSCRGIGTNDAMQQLTQLGYRATALLSREEQEPLWAYVKKSRCISGPDADKTMTQWFDLFSAISHSNYQKMSAISEKFLETGNYVQNREAQTYLISIGLLGELMLGKKETATERWHKWKDTLDNSNIDLPLQLIVSQLENSI